MVGAFDSAWNVVKAAARMSPVGGSQTRTSFSHGPGPRGYFGSPRASEREDRPREAPPMATTGPVSPDESLAESFTTHPEVYVQPDVNRKFMSQGEAKPMTMQDNVDMTPIEEAIKDMQRQREMAFRQTPEGRRQTFKEHMQSIPYIERGKRYGGNTPHMFRTEDGFVMFG